MGFGRDNNFFFWLRSGEPSPLAVHFAFVAKSRAIVDAFYSAATCSKPGPRTTSRTARIEARGTTPTTWRAADVLGPDGYSVEVVIKTPEIGEAK